MAFFLSGSSARKLKRGSANLLPGRALIVQMGPLTLDEFEFEDLRRVLVLGTLPEVIEKISSGRGDLEIRELLLSYSAGYLK